MGYRVNWSHIDNFLDEGGANTKPFLAGAKNKSAHCRLDGMMGCLFISFGQLGSVFIS
jgi:hypothetical protein